MIASALVLPRRRLGWLGMFAVLAPAAGAQGTRDDYARAASYDQRTRGLVHRDEVRPRFPGAGASFWYRVGVAVDRHEFVFVDPDRALREPLFDHAALAAALTGAAKVDPPVSPTALPLTRVEVDAAAGVVRFRAYDRLWSWDRATRTLVVREGVAPAIVPTAASSAPSRSRGGSAVRISIVNDHATEVEVFWLDFDGGRRSYGILAPGASLEQSTFRRHVFVAVNRDGADVAAIVIPDDAEDGDEAHVPREILVSERRGESGGRADRGVSSPDDNFELRVDGGSLVLASRGDGVESRFAAAEFGGHAFSGPLVWAPDSRRCAVLLRAKGDERKVTIVESSPRDRVQPKTHVFDYDKPGDALASPRVAMLDVETRTIRAIEPASIQDEAWSVDSLRWSADGSTFTFLFNARGHRTLRVIEVDAKTAVARTVLEETSPTFIDYSNKTFLHFLQRSPDFLWMSERSGWNHLYRVDARSGQVRNAVTSGEFVVKRVVEIDEENARVYLVAVGARPGEDPYHEHFCRVSLDGSKFERLTEGDGTHSFTFTPDKRFFLDTWSRVDHPPVTELRRSDDGTLVLELERADWSGLLATGFRPAERFVAKGRDGATAIHGIIVRPDDYDPAKRYPIVEHVYAGPHDHHVPKAFSRLVFEHELAELEFVVVRIDGMGTNWRSKAFHDVCWRNLKDAGLPDRIAWIRAAAEHDPALDLSRVGILGGSAGGQNALAALLHHGDFYRVAVADCGCHDNRMDKVWWNEAWMGWPVGDWYAENSNVTHAGKLAGKLLLIVGELDRNVDPASTMQVVDALVRADRDFEMLVLPGIGHGAAETPYGRRRRADFLVRHLLGVEPRSR